MTTEAPEEAYSYHRFSHPAQRHGDSLRRQTEGSVLYAADLGLTLLEPIEELGTSAFRGAHRRKGSPLARFLDLVSEGKIKRGTRLLIENLDRLSREPPLISFEIIQQLVKGGITLVTLNDRQCYTLESLSKNPSELYVVLGALQRAHEESRRKSDLLKAAWFRKRSEIAIKKFTKATPSWIMVAPNGDDWVFVEPHASTVRRMFHLCIAGMGKDAIARIFNDEGVPTFRGADGWHGSIILQVLHNRATIGEYQPKSRMSGKRELVGDPVPNYFDAVIDEQTFYLAQAALAKRNQGNNGRKGDTLSNIFSGLARCECGATMRYRDAGASKSGTRWTYLMCARAWRNQGCGNKRRYRYGPLETTVFETVTDVVLPSAGQPDELLSERRLEAKTAEGDDLRQRISNLLTIAERSPAAGFRVLELEDQLSEVEKQIASITLEIATRPRGEADDRRIALKQVWDGLRGEAASQQFETRHRLSTGLRGIVDSMEFNADGTVDLAILSGAKGYRFSEGMLEDSFDLTPRVGVYGGFKPEVFTGSNPERIEKLQRIRTPLSDGDIAFYEAQGAGFIRK